MLKAILSQAFKLKEGAETRHGTPKEHDSMVKE